MFVDVHVTRAVPIWYYFSASYVYDDRWVEKKYIIKVEIKRGLKFSYLKKMCALYCLHRRVSETSIFFRKYTRTTIRHGAAIKMLEYQLQD